MHPEELPPEPIIAAYGLEGATFEPISIGLINRTYRVLRDGRPALVLQRQHPVFTADVNEDIEAITAHVAAKGLPTPRIVRTRDGKLCAVIDGVTWRALTHLDGAVVSRVERPELARAAASLVARFHAAVDDLRHVFRFTRPGAHDTSAHLERLRAALERHRDHAEIDEVRPIADAILAHPLPKVAPTRTRIIHGDLKISNVLFEASFARAHALLDLDTLQHGTLAVELGDALRSWCNPAGENEADVEVDLAIYDAALAGYAEGGALTRDEVASIPLGLETIALELSSRFCLDALEDRYFGWDASKHTSRRAHNRVRARSQLALARSAARHRDELAAIAARRFNL